MNPGGRLTRRLALVLVAAALTVVAIAAQERGSPVVILVSFDGWRWDYVDRAKVPNLRALASRGVLAQGLIPSFPPLTFPNHYTLVTGLYPEHHGIVGNTIVDPWIPGRFTMSATTARDPRWWGGEPVWATAMRQGLRTASMFWPGSEAPIGGLQPTYWRSFDDRVPNAQRVAQVLDWLALPAGRRPSFVTVYFSEVDHAGHDYGPDSPQVLNAARHLDDALGNLLAGVDTLHLLDRASVVVVSDHGMSTLSDDRLIFLDDYLDLSHVDVVEWSPNLGLAARPGVDEALIYEALKGRHPALAIYRRDEMPERLHYRRNARIPPILGLADEGWRITSHARLAADRAAGRPFGGAHGYDPQFRSMHGLFVAAGPRIRQGVRVSRFENVHVYDFLCDLLGVTPADNDGDPAVTRPFLRD